jgi:hypothetical protein
MSTFLKLKRSSTSPTSTPGNLRNGEPAYSYGAGTYPDKVQAGGGSSVNAGGKLFVGQGTEDGSGHAANIDVIGGKYFTDMLDHQHGTLTANSALVIDQDSKIDIFNVDNLRFDSNTISSTNSNGDIILDPAGSGEINIVDDTFLSFGSDKDAKIEYDENSSDQVQVTGADWTYNNVNVTITGNLVTTGTSSTSIPDDTADAFEVKEGSNQYIAIDTTNGSELITFGSGNVDFDNDVNIDGGDLTTNQASFNLLNTTATTINAFGAATAINIGASGANTTTLGSGTLVGTETTQNVFNATATTVNAFGAGSDINIGASGAGATTFGNNTVDGTETTQNVFNTTATTVNAFGAATGLNVGANSGTMTIGNPTVVGTQTTQNLYNTTATSVNAFGAATAIDIGAASGTTSINNNLDIDLDLNVDGGDITTNQTSFNLLNTTATTVNAFGAATTINMGTASTMLDLGHIRIQGNEISTDNLNAQDLVLDPFPDAGDAGGNVIIRGNLQVAGTTTTVNSTEMSVNDPVFTIGDTVSEKTVMSAASSGATDLVIDNPSSIVEGASITGTSIPNSTTISNVRISFNVSQNFGSAPSSGATLYFYNGESFAEVGTFVSQTASEVTLDLASNISTRGDDFYNGNSLSSVGTGTPASAQLASITKVNTKVFNTTTITVSNAISAGIDAEAKLTISQASDDNMDRGIQFKYLDGSSSKLGFFGYDETTTTEGEKYFSYIPDSTNNANVFAGTRGAAWFKTVKLDDGILNGVAFFDQYKRLTRTVAAGSADQDTSYQLLTVTSSGVPVWSTTLDGGTY